MNPTDENPINNASHASAASVCEAFANAFKELGHAMAPAPNVEQHFREAGKQFLMGIRDFIDNRIQDLSKTETKGTRVDVE